MNKQNMCLKVELSISLFLFKKIDMQRLPLKEVYKSEVLFAPPKVLVNGKHIAGLYW